LSTPLPPAYPPGLYGLLAEYGSAQELLEAVKTVRAAGHRAIDAFTPFPVEAIAHEVTDHERSKVPLICLVGGITGALGGWGLAFWTSTIDYPMNIGGKPFNSWPAFIPVIFECTVLVAAFSAAIGMLVLNRLPEPYHPVFNVESFRRKASRDGFFLCVEATDARFRHDETLSLLHETGALEVSDVDL
jgi:hypothetical protein